MATDLDGTLVRSDYSISDHTVATLQAVQAIGVQVVFVTGRPPRWLAEVAHRTGATGLAICANGALVYDLGAERVVERFPLACDVGLDLIRRLRAALPSVRFAVEHADGHAHEPRYPRPFGADLIPPRRVAPVEELLAGADEPVKLLARCDDLSADELLAAGRDVLGDLAELTHSSLNGLLEISAAGVSKATTLAALCAERGVPAEEVAAFGDMPNDLPMLAWAGHPYAMANAHPAVLAAVESRAPANDDDGVAVVLSRLVPQSQVPNSGRGVQPHR